MKKTIALILITAFLAFNKQNLKAQQHFDVEVSSFKYVPETLQVAVGDTVTWTNVQGNHNVNGNTNKYPNNPEGFMNAVGGPGWTYTFVFTKEGFYDYLCDPHASFMTGAVEVSSALSVNNPELELISLYPNPAKAGNTVVINGLNSESKPYILSDNLGSVIKSSTNNSIVLPKNMASGIYYVKHSGKTVKLLVE